jgi:hypothetical protein
MAESDETARAIVAGQTGSLEVVKMALSNVRFVQKADIQELRAPAGGQRCALDRSGTHLPRC